MASELKHEIRLTIVKWQLSVKGRSERAELFIKNVFRELDGLMETVYIKHDGSSTNNDCHKIIDIWPLARKTIAKMHKSITRRLRAEPTTVSPYFCEFTHVSKELFDIMQENILERTSFGLTSSSTKAIRTIRITDKRKAVYFFNYLNKDAFTIEKDNLLSKEFQDKSCAEVVISEEKPMIMKYNNNSEVLSVTFHYGYWTSDGVRQH